MSRTVTLSNEEVQIRLRGLTSLAALKRKMDIPYQNIIRVETHGPNIQSLMRLGGAAFGDACHGEFYGDGWYFLSFEHPDKVVSMTLSGYEDGGRIYRGVVIGVDQPGQTKADIEARCGKPRE